MIHISLPLAITLTNQSHCFSSHKQSHHHAYYYLHVHQHYWLHHGAATHTLHCISSRYYLHRDLWWHKPPLSSGYALGLGSVYCHKFLAPCYNYNLLVPNILYDYDIKCTWYYLSPQSCTNNLNFKMCSRKQLRWLPTTSSSALRLLRCASSVMIVWDKARWKGLISSYPW